MYPDKLLNVEEVNRLSFEQFVSLFENMIEHTPDAAHHAALMRPFSIKIALKEAFNDYLEKLDVAGKESILLKHPDLRRKSVITESLTIESQNEQKAAGLNVISMQEDEQLTSLNYLYKKKFGFPFVICAKENNIITIITSLTERLKNSREVELNNGINEIKKICALRIDNLVLPDT